MNGTRLTFTLALSTHSHNIYHLIKRMDLLRLPHEGTLQPYQHVTSPAEITWRHQHMMITAVGAKTCPCRQLGAAEIADHAPHSAKNWTLAGSAS
jgi:hypothetical protein